MPTATNSHNNTNDFSFFNTTSVDFGTFYGPKSAFIYTTTAMFRSNLSVKHGFVKATYIFVSDTNNTAFFGEDFKITGDVYLVKEEDYNKIWWTWTNAGMKKYIEDHHLKPVHYENESYYAHINELQANYDEYVKLEELQAPIDTEGLPIAAIVS